MLIAAGWQSTPLLSGGPLSGGNGRRSAVGGLFWALFLFPLAEEMLRPPETSALETA